MYREPVVFFALTILALVQIPVFDAFAQYENAYTFTNSNEPYFSFSYPLEWQKSENFLVGEGWLASFYDNLLSTDSVLDVYVYENDNSLQNSKSEEIIDYAFLSYFFLCSESTFDQTGYECFDFTPLDYKIFKVDSKDAYQIKYSWFQVFPDGSIKENINTITDIWTGGANGKIVSIQSQIDSENYDFYVNSYDQLLNSVSFLKESEVESSLIPADIKFDAGLWAYDFITDEEFIADTQFLIEQNIVKTDLPPTDISYFPTWTKDVALWWAEGLISDYEFVNVIEYLIESDIIT